MAKGFQCLAEYLVFDPAAGVQCIPVDKLRKDKLACMPPPPPPPPPPPSSARTRAIPHCEGLTQESRALAARLAIGGDIGQSLSRKQKPAVTLLVGSWVLRALANSRDLGGGPRYHLRDCARSYAHPCDLGRLHASAPNKAGLRKGPLLRVWGPPRQVLGVEFTNSFRSALRRAGSPGLSAQLVLFPSSQGPLNRASDLHLPVHRRLPAPPPPAPRPDSLRVSAPAALRLTAPLPRLAPWAAGRESAEAGEPDVPAKVDEEKDFPRRLVNSRVRVRVEERKEGFGDCSASPSGRGDRFPSAAPRGSSFPVCPRASSPQSKAGEAGKEAGRGRRLRPLPRSRSPPSLLFSCTLGSRVICIVQAPLPDGSPSRPLPHSCPRPPTSPPWTLLRRYGRFRLGRLAPPDGVATVTGWNVEEIEVPTRFPGGQ
ncbi:WAS/WASL-interacting protein family member 3-like [Trichosurus vulpecula]|uniref:WAS/WASL-interacting protein family member 3-like n=1 Tax=Trichosurus vulpecula TaxID=9337 RepID=UPI00186AEF3B|nr:WAS/WASL-interacting protein family member 3-like [Trichosurus vulpecula]